MHLTLKRFAVAGVVTSLPATLLVIAGLAQSLLGFRQINDVLDSLLTHPSFGFAKVFVSPLIVLGGLAVACIVNVIAVCRIQFNEDENSIVFRVLLRGRWWNLLVIAGSLTITGILLLYMIFENVRFIPTTQG